MPEAILLVVSLIFAALIVLFVIVALAVIVKDLL